MYNLFQAAIDFLPENFGISLEYRQMMSGRLTETYWLERSCQAANPRLSIGNTTGKKIVGVYYFEILSQK
jgi:hypothetical protein